MLQKATEKIPIPNPTLDHEEESHGQLNQESFFLFLRGAGQFDGSEFIHQPCTFFQRRHRIITWGDEDEIAFLSGTKQAGCLNRDVL